MTETATVRSIKRQPEWTINDAFPEVDHGVYPLGHKVLLQIRTSRPKSSGGIILPQDSREYEKLTSQVAKVLALGKLCFQNRTSGEGWPEGDWVKRGDFVLIPQYGGHRWNIPYQEKSADAVGMIDITFVILNDFELPAGISGDPLKIKSCL